MTMQVAEPVRATGGMEVAETGPDGGDPRLRCKAAVLAGPTMQLPGAGEELSGIVNLTSSVGFAGPVNVAPGTVFLVPMGDAVKFTSGVDPIVMTGTSEAPITFCGKHSEQGPGLWQGLTVDGGPGTQLQNVVIVGAGAEQHAAFEATENARVVNLTVTASASDAVLSRSGFAEGTDGLSVDNVSGAPLRIAHEDGFRNLPKTIAATAVSTATAIVDISSIGRPGLTIPALDIPYLLPGRRFEFEAATTIEPGTHFAVQAAGRVEFSASNGIFTVEGTADAPIVFAPLDERAPASWYGVYVFDAHEESRFSDLVIRGGGREDTFAFETDDEFFLENVTVEDSVNGAYLRRGLVSGSSGLSVRGADRIAAKIHTRDIDRFPAGGSLSENAFPMLRVEGGGGELKAGNSPKMVRRLDVPYYLANGPAHRWSAHVVVEAGTEFVAQEGAVLNLHDSTMTIVGTEGEPIVFRGERDVPGLWGGIQFTDAKPNSLFEHVSIRNAGSRGYSLTFVFENARVSDCSFELGLGYGISGTFTDGEIAALEADNTFMNIEGLPVGRR